MSATSVIVLNSRQVASLLNGRLGTRYSYRSIYYRLRDTASCPIRLRYCRANNGRLTAVIAADEYPLVEAWIAGKPTGTCAPVTQAELTAVGAVSANRSDAAVPQLPESRNGNVAIAQPAA